MLLHTFLISPLIMKVRSMYMGHIRVVQYFAGGGSRPCLTPPDCTDVAVILSWHCQLLPCSELLKSLGQLSWKKVEPTVGVAQICYPLAAPFQFLLLQRRSWNCVVGKWKSCWSRRKRWGDAAGLLGSCQKEPHRPHVWTHWSIWLFTLWRMQ